jgi:hypothetical protein
MRAQNTEEQNMRVGIKVYNCTGSPLKVDIGHSNCNIEWNSGLRGALLESGDSAGVSFIGSGEFSATITVSVENPKGKRSYRLSFKADASNKNISTQQSEDDKYVRITKEDRGRYTDDSGGEVIFRFHEL